VLGVDPFPRKIPTTIRIANIIKMMKNRRFKFVFS
jgi:hypothetical protein